MHAPPSSSALPRRPAVVLAAAVLGSAALWTLWSSWKAWGLQSTWALDLALYHSAAWNLAEGNGFTNTLFPHRGDGLFAQDHFEPILVLASFAYGLVPRLETLFFIQAALMALGAVPVAALLRQEGLRPWPAVAGAGIYLVWWPIWRLAMMDIRPVMWSVPFVLLVLVALRGSCVRRTLLWGFLACLCREELPLVLCAAAGVAWFWKDPERSSWFDGRRRACVALAALSVLYLGVTWIVRSDPTVHGLGIDWTGALTGVGTGEGGFSPLGVLPSRLAWMAEWGLPVAIGAIAAPELLVVALPGALYLFVSEIEWTLWNDSRTHYVAVLLPGLVAASVVGWARILSKVHHGRPKWIRPGALVGAGLLLSHLVGSSIGWTTYVAPEIEGAQTPSAELLVIHEWIAALPPEASVLTSGSPVHLVAPRRHVFVIEEEHPPPAAASPPLIPRAAVDPAWAILPRVALFWRDRALAAGLSVLGGTENFILLGPTEHSCPTGMLALPAGNYLLGEADAAWAQRFPEGLIVAQNWALGPACVAQDPFPGAPHPWFPDGLILGDFPQLERALSATGRRLCSVGELLLASAGASNWRYPYHSSSRSRDLCDPNDPAPDSFGSHAGCISPVGARDFMVRSSWARADSGAKGFGGLVVVGGLVREDTVYAPTNFGVHGHLITDPRNFEDDGLRLCAPPGIPNSGQAEAWEAFLALAVAEGSFEGLLDALGAEEAPSL